MLTLSELIRYVINGVVATAAHYFVLIINLNVLNFSVGRLGEPYGCFFGIAVSFIGNRYFVFKNYYEPIWYQLTKFGVLYFVTAILHGIILFIWSDRLSFTYHISFIFAITVQVIISYFGNKFLVFK